MRDWVIYDPGFATVPKSVKRDTTDSSCAFVRQITAAEINNMAVTNDDPVVPVAHASFDTTYLRLALNPNMGAEFEHCSKVAMSPERPCDQDRRSFDRG